MNYKLVTSNEKKLQEFRDFGMNLDIQKGLDLPEIDSNDPILVILHKSKLAGKGTIVEDTTVEIGARSVVDIRYRLDEMKENEGKKITWITLLAKNNGTNIFVFLGRVSGRIRIPEIMPEGAFAFDPYFVPDGETKTLHELDQEGLKKNFSARKLAADDMLCEDTFLVSTIKDIKEWKGEYQQ